MSETTYSVRKLTVSLPARLADFLDREALRLNVSRSKLVADALRDHFNAYVEEQGDHSQKEMRELPYACPFCDGLTYGFVFSFRVNFRQMCKLEKQSQQYKDYGHHYVGHDNPVCHFIEYKRT